MNPQLTIEEVKFISKAVQNVIHQKSFKDGFPKAVTLRDYSLLVKRDGSWQFKWNPTIRDNNQTEPVVIFPIPVFSDEQIAAPMDQELDFQILVAEFVESIFNWEYAYIRFLES